MKRYDIFAAVANGRPEIDVCEDPEGDWVKWDDHAEKVARLERINKRLATQVCYLIGALADAGQ